MAAASNGNNRRRARTNTGTGGQSQSELLKQIIEETRAGAAMYAEAGRTTASLAEQVAALPNLINQVLDYMVSSQVTEYAPGYAPSSGGAPRGAAPRAKDNGTHRPVHTSGPAPSSLHPSVVSRDRGLDAYRQHQNHETGLSGIRNRVNSAMGEMIHNRFGAGANENVFRPHSYDETGKVASYAAYNKIGQQVGVHAADSAVVKQATRQGAVSSVAASLSEGGLAGAARAIPMAGAVTSVIGGAFEGAHIVGSERQSNAQFQSIYGGSNFAGFGQRLDRTGFRLGQMFGGGLTGGDADKAFNAVSSLGYQGQRRSSALNFISSNYGSMGMGVDQSIGLVNTQAHQFNLTLSDLAKSLKGVTAVAKETGQNANLLRGAYAQNLTAAAQNGAGASSSIYSQAFVSATSSGDTAQLFQGVNLSSLMNYTSQSIAAGSVGGLTQGQFEGQAGLNPQLGAQGYQAVLNNVFKAFVTQAVRTEIEGQVKSRGGPQAVASNSNLMATIGMDLLAKGLISAVQPLRDAANNQTGGASGGSGIFGPQSQTSDAAVMGYFVGWYVSTQMGSASAGLTGNIVGAVNASTSSMQQSPLTNTQRQALEPVDLSGAAAKAGGGASAGGPNGPYSATGSKGNAVSSWELTNNIKDPVLEKLRTDLGNDVKLSFDGGKTSMSLANALKNPNLVKQLDIGNAQVASGAHKGQTLSELGITNLPNFGGTTATSVTNGSSISANGVTITFNGDPALLKKLGIKATVSTAVTQGAANGAPPAPATGQTGSGTTSTGPN